MSYWRLFYHAVWSTKYRQPLIDSSWEKDLYGYLWGKAIALECIPHAINGMPDHIHIVLSIPPKLAIATIIGKLKGASSHHINENFLGDGFAWQDEYSIFSLSESALERAMGYVKGQKSHHAESTLITKFEALSEKPTGLPH
ncbi:MAG TPA: IS200/IS605 family transposase [Anaerolineales bacterium]|nr:IS200/IS605 family transposase [Anaerolineales bacterium]